MTLKRKRGVSCFKLTIYLSARERSEEFPTQRGSSFEELASQPENVIYIVKGANASSASGYACKSRCT